MNDLPEWTSTETVANVTGEELASAFGRMGVGAEFVGADSDGDVHVYFRSIQDASAFLSLVLCEDQPGTLYDRATAHCLSMSLLPEDATQAQVEALIRSGWNWTVHPHMSGRRVGWHVKVMMTTNDAAQVASVLNTLAAGGAL